MADNIRARIEHPFVITPQGVTVTSLDGITVSITGNGAPDTILPRMFKDAMKEIRRIRKENLGR